MHGQKNIKFGWLEFRRTGWYIRRLDPWWSDAYIVPKRR